MDSIKKFLRDESGIYGGALFAIMMGMASGISGIWNSLINNPLALILVVLTLVIVFWIIIKA